MKMILREYNITDPTRITKYPQNVRCKTLQWVFKQKSQFLAFYSIPRFNSSTRLSHIYSGERSCLESNILRLWEENGYVQIRDFITGNCWKSWSQIEIGLLHSNTILKWAFIRLKPLLENFDIKKI